MLWRTRALALDKERRARHHEESLEERKQRARLIRVSNKTVDTAYVEQVQFLLH